MKDAMEQSLAPGSQTFEQALFKLYRADSIDLDEAMTNADSPTNLHWLINNAAPKARQPQPRRQPANRAARLQPSRPRGPQAGRPLQHQAQSRRSRLAAAIRQPRPITNQSETWLAPAALAAIGQIDQRGFEQRLAAREPRKPKPIDRRTERSAATSRYGVEDVTGGQVFERSSPFGRMPLQTLDAALDEDVIVGVEAEAEAEERACVHECERLEPVNLSRRIVLGLGCPGTEVIGMPGSLNRSVVSTMPSMKSPLSTPWYRIHVEVDHRVERGAERDAERAEDREEMRGNSAGIFCSGKL